MNEHTGLKVVVAEDEAIIRLDIVEILEESGYLVVGETGRGDEAVELVRKTAPDVAILDIKMPVKDGLKVAEEINSVDGPAIIILTAFSQRDYINSAKASGAMAYLIKPFDKNDLMPAIELAVARKEENKMLVKELQNLENDVKKAAELVQSRKLLDRAKGYLMDNFEMAEAEAFRFIQKQAMSSRRKMVDVAKEVIDGQLRPK